jgi:hypothetical protein
VFFHQWLGNKKKEGSSKKSKFLEELYPNKKLDEIEIMAKLSTDKELKDLARRHGYDEATIAKKIK